MCDSWGRVSVEAVQPGILVGLGSIGGRIGGKEVVQPGCCKGCRRICFGISQGFDEIDRVEQEETHLPRQPRTRCSKPVLPSVV